MENGGWRSGGATLQVQVSSNVPLRPISKETGCTKDYTIPQKAKMKGATRKCIGFRTPCTCLNVYVYISAEKQEYQKPLISKK